MFGVKEKEEIHKETKIHIGIIIDDKFIMRDDLRDWVFEEDEDGRFRERIIDEIERIGVLNWFKIKGYPINPESIWKNRYTGSLGTLGEEIHEYDNEFKTGNLQERGYYLWENNLPIEIWNDKDLMEQYRVGSLEYTRRIMEEEKARKKYARNKNSEVSIVS
jgi:hypothetical protein